MEALRQYVLSVVTAALVCGIATELFPNGRGKQVIKLLGGLFLAYAVLSPVSRGDFSEILDFPYSYEEEAAAAAGVGENLARESMADIIKAETEAYILDKAADLRAEVTVEVTVNEENVPSKVTITGEASPYARRQLQDAIESDLGIPKENQQWTG